MLRSILLVRETAAAGGVVAAAAHEAAARRQIEVERFRIAASRDFDRAEDCPLVANQGARLDDLSLGAKNAGQAVTKCRGLTWRERHVPTRDDRAIRIEQAQEDARAKARHGHPRG